MKKDSEFVFHFCGNNTVIVRSPVHGYASTLEFQVEGKGGINREAGTLRQKIIKGEGVNKRRGWQNTAIGTFIEIKSLNDLVKISTKRT